MKASPPHPAVRPSRLRESHAHALLLRNQSELDRTLLGLHAVQEIPEFWRMARRVTRAALPLDFICLCLRPFALIPSTVFRERWPFASDEEFKQFQQLSPVNDFLAARPGTRVVRMSDILPETELLRTEFFRRFMLPYGERHFACLCFWHAGIFEGMIGLHRTTAQGDFASTELEVLHRLHPHFDTVVRRILDRHRERAVRLSLEKLLGNLPIATVLLDWELRVIYRNRSAVELCALWNLGPERARREKCVDDFRLPAEVMEYCANFKSGWNPCHHRSCPLTTPGGVSIAHGGTPGLRATINLLQLDAAPLSMPLFLVRLEQSGVNGHRSGSGNGLELARISRLSPREREVALLAGEGCSNQEIARRLHKSVLTVKKQLRSIYGKLEIANRGRLIALMR